MILKKLVMAAMISAPIIASVQAAKQDIQKLDPKLSPKLEANLKELRHLRDSAEKQFKLMEKEAIALKAKKDIKTEDLKVAKGIRLGLVKAMDEIDDRVAEFITQVKQAYSAETDEGKKAESMAGLNLIRSVVEELKAKKIYLSTIINELQRKAEDNLLPQ